MDSVSSSCSNSKSFLQKTAKVYTFLPEDLRIEILLRLPVKSLLRFKSVCHQWNTIITSISFTRGHVRLGSCFTSSLVYWCRDADNPESELRLEPASNFTYDDINVCSLFPDGTSERHLVSDLPGKFCGISGPCNGVFCVNFGNETTRKWVEKTICLWNPSTRRLRTLPSCPYPDLITTRFDICLGVDPITDDLKIVLVRLLCKQRQFAIYSLRNDSWKLFESELLFDPSFSLSKNYCGRSFSNGFCYWIKSRRNSILAFDMHSDLFQEIEMPKIIERNLRIPTLDMFNDTLALVSNEWDDDSNRIEIWLMKERGCWKKHTTVSIPFKCYGPVVNWKRNQIIARTFKDRELIICDLDTANIRNLEVGRGNRLYVSTFHVFPCEYKESLVSV